MKKDRLIAGSLYALFGVACLSIALLSETKLEGILWGLAGAGIGPGIAMVFQYFYWSSPRNSERYKAMTENKRIEMHDELKIKLRDRAGRYAYVLGLCVTCIAILVFSVLGALDVIEDTRIVLLYLCGYLVFQELAGIVIFSRLMKKY